MKNKLLRVDKNLFNMVEHEASVKGLSQNQLIEDILYKYFKYPTSNSNINIDKTLDLILTNEIEIIDILKKSAQI